MSHASCRAPLRVIPSEANNLPASRPAPFYSVGNGVFEGSSNAVAAARTRDEARRIAAVLNATHGIPTESLEAWSIDSVQDPASDAAAELEAVLGPRASQDRRAVERRQSDRRRAIHEVRIEVE